jgi:NADH-quinone oxidoreductase subunit L
VKWAPLIASILGALIAAWIYVEGRRLGRRSPRARAARSTFLYNKWFFDELYHAVFVRGQGARRPVLEGRRPEAHRRPRPDGVAWSSLEVGRRLAKLQSGYVYHYAFVMLLGVAGC